MDRVFWSNNKINEWKFKDSKYHTDEEKIMAKEAQYNEKYRDSIYYLQKKDYDEDHDVKYIYPMNDERYLKSKKIIYEYSYNEFKKRTLPKNNEINGEFKEIDNLIKYYEKEGLTQYISNYFYETLEKTKETKKVFDNYGQVYTITISNLSKQIEIAHKKEIRKTIVSTTILIVIIAMIILFFKFFKK